MKLPKWIPVTQIAKLVRDRAFVSTIVLVFVAFGAAVAAMLAVGNVMVLSNADRFVQDWEVASLAPAEPQDRDIVIIAIKESTLGLFPYRSPVDRAFLADLLKTLAARHPRAIGVDILFDQPTDPAKDEVLRRTVATLRVPLVVAYTNLASIVTPVQSAYLNRFVPVAMRADPTLPEDQYDTVRSIFPGTRDARGRYIPGFAAALAGAVGRTAPTTDVPIIWHGRPSRDVAPFREFAAENAAVLPANWLAGKIILVGADLSLREDRHRTPYASILPGGEGTWPGVVIHAHGLAQILDRHRHVHVLWKTDFIVAFACAILGGFLGVLQLHILLRVLAGSLFLVVFWAIGAALYHASGAMIGLMSPSVAFVFTFSALESLAGREARHQRQFIEGAFSRYVTPEIVKELVRDPSKMSLQGERRLLSLLFADIVSFTSYSEGLESHELTQRLNRYFDGVTQIVLRHGGMVDKFIGDAVFAIFNAPVDLPDHAGHAVRCALEIDAFGREFGKPNAGSAAGFGATRVGVHTGFAVIGNFGSSRRFTYTAQGDAVNTASRLEALNKHFGTHICVSGDTKKACSGIAFRPVGSVILKGKRSAVEVWEPLQPGALSDDFLALYCAAYEKLSRSAPDTLALFQTLNAQNPDDPCTRLHLDRLRRGENGVTVAMESK